jgi:hypothetical protein
VTLPDLYRDPSELARRIIRSLADPPGKDMRNRIEFLSNW